jgi:hypothetical protein
MQVRIILLFIYSKFVGDAAIAMAPLPWATARRVGASQENMPLTKVFNRRLRLCLHYRLMENERRIRSNKSRPLLEPAVRSGILAAPLVLMLAAIVVLSGGEPKQSTMIDQTFTGSVSPLKR